MKIAIIGAGLAGLGTAYYLLHHSRGGVSIDIFDPLPIGKGVSGLSSGLLHPYPGRKAERMANADLYLNATHFLLMEATQGLGRSVVVSTGILRPALTEVQSGNFQKTAAAHEDTQWWSVSECTQKMVGLHLPEYGGGLLIKSGLTIDVPAYLEGLWERCLRFGVQFFQKAVTKEKELEPYERVIFAVGANIRRYPFFTDLPVEAVKGQSVRLRWPAHLPPLPCSLIASDAHLVMDREGKTCIAGATFERDFVDVKPDPARALSLIMKKIVPFFPPLAEAPPLEFYAGIRAMPPRNKGPLVGNISPKYWFITGLGAKGLLLHGHLSNLLAKQILTLP